MFAISVYAVGFDVLSQEIPLANHRNGIAHVYPRHFEGGRYVSVVFGRVRQLVLVVLGLGVGYVEGLLPRIVTAEVQVYAFA